MGTAMRNAAAMLSTGDDAPTDDAALVQAARHDPTAFGTLYTRYAARMYSYMRTRTPTDDDAADLSAHVFLKAWQAFPHYHERGVPFSAWLFRIAHNVVTDVYRQRRRTVSWEDLPETFHPTTTEDPEAVVLRREAYRRVQAHVAGLDVARRELIMLRFVARLTLREIAFVLGKSESAVHKQLVLTLRTLKEQTDDG